MRPSLKLALLSACAATAGCASHSAYGLDSDDRLEATFSERASGQGADVAGVKCDALSRKFKASRIEERTEAERLKVLVELFEKSRENTNALDDAAAKNPDLLYGSEGDAVKANLAECRATYADVRSDFDRFIRDLTELPVIQELQGREMVTVPRLDLKLLRSAIATLDPDDKDMLLGKLDMAEKRVGESERIGRGGGRRR
ncbi:MAG TPA: hypothetical protein DFS52_30180 [Myxococcales bacterium]|jgi:hypothetical protein|nr:hypothetical protein [Myxococcales bacterium]